MCRHLHASQGFKKMYFNYKMVNYLTLELRSSFWEKTKKSRALPTLVVQSALKTT